MKTDLTFIDLFAGLGGFHVVKKPKSGGGGGIDEGRFLSARTQGFPLGDSCLIQRTQKLRSIKKIIPDKGVKIIQYLGIAYDEPIRLKRLKPNQISLLAKYKYTESMALDKCKEYGLLSPIYEEGKRGGCWFCPNQNIPSFCRLRKKHPELWGKLVELSKTPNLISYGFKYGMTIPELEKKMDEYDLKQEYESMQLKLFE